MLLAKITILIKFHLSELYIFFFEIYTKFSSILDQVDSAKFYKLII